MEEKELQNLEEQVPQENYEQPQEYPQEEAQEQQVQPKSNKEENFAALREKVEREKKERERIERERDEAYNLLRQIEQRAIQYQQPQQEEYIPDHVSDDDIIDGKMLKAIQRKQEIELQKLKQEIAKSSTKQAEILVENQIKTQFPDYYSVVNRDNIERLKELEPEVTATLAQMGDLYSQASLTYKWIKKLGLDGSSTTEQSRAYNNSTKPKPISSIAPSRSGSNLEHAASFDGDLSEERKQMIYQSMVRNASRR